MKLDLKLNSRSIYLVGILGSSEGELTIISYFHPDIYFWRNGNSAPLAGRLNNPKRRNNLTIFLNHVRCWSEADLCYYSTAFSYYQLRFYEASFRVKLVKRYLGSLLTTKTHFIIEWYYSWNS